MAPNSGPPYNPGGYPPPPQGGFSPQVRFDAIGEGWTLFTQQMGTWIAAGLIYMMIAGLLMGLCFGKMYYDVFSAISKGNTYALQALNTPGMRIWPAIGSAILAGILPFFYAGLYRMGIKQIRGESISVGDMFSITDVLPSLLQYMGIAALVSLVNGFLSLIPIVNLAAIVIGIGFAVFFVFTIPLIVDRRMGAIEALTTSYHAAKGQFLMVLLFVILAGLVGGIGAIACGIGVLFTFPIMILAHCILYRDFFLIPPPPAYTGPYGGYPPPPPPPSVPPIG